MRSGLYHKSSSLHQLVLRRKFMRMHHLGQTLFQKQHLLQLHQWNQLVTFWWVSSLNSLPKGHVFYWAAIVDCGSSFCVFYVFLGKLCAEGLKLVWKYQPWSLVWTVSSRQCSIITEVEYNCLFGRFQKSIQSTFHNNIWKFHKNLLKPRSICAASAASITDVSKGLSSFQKAITPSVNDLWVSKLRKALVASVVSWILNGSAGAVDGIELLYLSTSEVCLAIFYLYS